MIDKDYLKTFFKEKGIRLRCPICGSTYFTITPTDCIDNFGKIYLCNTRRVYISVYSCCENCNYMMFFSARSLGLIDEESNFTPKKLSAKAIVENWLDGIKKKLTKK